jgi:integrase
MAITDIIKTLPYWQTKCDQALDLGTPATIALEHGLYLKVSGPDRGSFLFRYRFSGSAKKLGMGAYRPGDNDALKQALTDALTYQQVLATGEDPKHCKVVLDDPNVTFERFARQWIEDNRNTWKNAKHADQWVNTLAFDAFPIIGHLPPAAITTRHIETILRKMIERGVYETASRVQERLAKVLGAAKKTGLIPKHQSNPALKDELDDGILKQLKRADDDSEPHPALDYHQAPAFWQQLAPLSHASAMALKLVILSGLRCSEVREISWNEVHLDSREVRIPRHRMKDKRAKRGLFILPLTDCMVEILLDMLQCRVPGNPWVFPGMYRKAANKQGPAGPTAISDRMILKVVETLHAKQLQIDGVGWVDPDYRPIDVHGWRATFNTWGVEAGAELGHQKHVVDRCLDHAVGNKTEEAYRRDKLIPQRLALLNDWHRHCLPQAPAPANVIPLRR